LKALISLRLLLLVEPFPFSFGCLLLRFMGFLNNLIFLRNPSPCRITVYFLAQSLVFCLAARHLAPLSFGKPQKRVARSIKILPSCRLPQSPFLRLSDEKRGSVHCPFCEPNQTAALLQSYSFLHHVAILH
jgi:hypothetical protein